MTVVSYTLNNDPLFPIDSLSFPAPSSGTPGGYLSGSFAIDFATDTLVSSNLTFTPTGGSAVTLSVANSSVSQPSSLLPIFAVDWSSPTISYNNNILSTDATGYEVNVYWSQSLGVTFSTVSLDYIGPQSSIDASGSITGTFLANDSGQVSTQVLSSAPGPLPGTGFFALGLLVLVLVASRAPKRS